MVLRFEPVWYEPRGVNSSLFVVEIQSSSSGWAWDLHDKRKSRSSLGPFYFLFSRPDVPRAEMLWILLACVGRSSLNPWLQNQVVASSD